MGIRDKLFSAELIQYKATRFGYAEPLELDATECKEQIFLEKLRNQTFITVFTTSHHYFLSRAT